MTKEQDSNGYFYGRTLVSHDQQAAKRQVTVFRFMIKYVTYTTPKPSGGPIPDIHYAWHILTFVTYWESGKVARLLCFDNPPQLQNAIEQSLREVPIDDLLAHPFAFHALILEHVAELYDHAIWQFRDFVRDTERQRLTIENPQPDYTAMHELSRHVMHCTEVLSTALNVMDHIIEELARSQQRPLQPFDYDPGPAIRHQKSMLQFMHNRSKAVEDRLKNEINLAFHVTSQHSNLISMQIAHAAQVDSRAMRTISILGLVFLPGTFISAVFSMSFFNFTPATVDQPGRWNVSEKFWLYWAVAIPVTALTVAVWWMWQKSMPTTPQVKFAAKANKEQKC